MITHEEFIKKYNIEKYDYYQKNGWLYLKNDYIIKIVDELPSKIEFIKKYNNDITIVNIKKIPSDVIFNNDRDVKIPYVEEISENVIFNNKGDLYLGELKKVHSSVKFINDGFIYFYYGTNKIPKGIIFNNRGGVNVSNVKKISENVIFNNGGHVILNRNIKVVFSKGVKFNNKGDIINVPIYVPKFLDPKKYLNKMIEQLFK